MPSAGDDPLFPSPIPSHARHLCLCFLLFVYSAIHDPVIWPATNLQIKYRFNEWSSSQETRCNLSRIHDSGRRSDVSDLFLSPPAHRWIQWVAFIHCDTVSKSFLTPQKRLSQLQGKILDKKMYSRETWKSGLIRLEGNKPFWLTTLHRWVSLVASKTRRNWLKMSLSMFDQPFETVTCLFRWEDWHVVSSDACETLQWANVQHSLTGQYNAEQSIRITMKMTPIFCHIVFTCCLILPIVRPAEAIPKQPDGRRLEQIARNGPSQDFTPFIALCGKLSVFSNASFPDNFDWCRPWLLCEFEAKEAAGILHREGHDEHLQQVHPISIGRMWSIVCQSD